MIVDLSHRIEDGRGAYPGLPPPRLGAILDHEASRDRYEGRAEFYLGWVELAGNTGTYVDAPFHRFPDRDDLAAIPLERLAGLPGVVATAADRGGPVEMALDAETVAGRAVLIRTGRDRRWGKEEYWHDAPFLDASVADRLVRAGAALVGVDFGNVDDTGDPVRPAHTRLLEAGIPIVESLRGLDALPPGDFRFTAAPLPLVRGASFPVRAFAEIP